MRQSDAYFGTLAALIVNVTRGPGQPAAKPSDFFGASRSVARQSPEEMRAVLSAYGKRRNTR